MIMVYDNINFLYVFVQKYMFINVFHQQNCLKHPCFCYYISPQNSPSMQTKLTALEGLCHKFRIG
jgi:hypothetical protein